MNNIISCQNIHYHYNDGARTTSILKGLNLEVKNGESIAILGQSGCGKSTLLNVLGGIDKVNTGQLLINNTDISTLNEKKITELRAKHLGFVYQFHHLLKDFNALKNIMMPLLIQGVDSKTAKANAMALLKQMNLTHRATHLPGELSGGERQRVAIGRALINQPQCLLADEPTAVLPTSISRVLDGDIK